MKRELACISLVGAAIAVASCGSPVTTAKQDAPPVTTITSTSIGTGTVNNAAGFALSMTSTATVTLHQANVSYGGSPDTSNFSAPCTVMPGASGPAVDILCIAEVAELDLYFQSLAVTYNVPQNMCTYLRVTPYDFWALEPGTGNSLFNKTVNTNGSTTYGPGYLNQAPACPYDYSGFGGPNCCNGNFQEVTTVLTASTATSYSTSTSTSGGTTSTSTATTVTTTTTTSTSTSTGSWTGAPGNCLSGPATVSQAKDSFTKYPVSTLYYVASQGLNQTYTIPAAINSTFNSGRVGSDLWSANFYNPAEHTYSGTATITTTDTSVHTNTYTDLGFVPDPFTMKSRSTSMRVPNNLTINAYLPSDTYEFGCFDQAEELQYRIRLMVRKWNQEPITQNCTTNCPDSGAGQYESFPDPTLPLDSRLDWHDLQARYPGLSNI